MPIISILFWVLGTINDKYRNCTKNDRYASDDEFHPFGPMMDTIRGRARKGPLPLKAGIVNVLPKLIVCKLLEPALCLPEKVHLICHEDNETRLLTEQAMHNIDLVLSDSPVRKGLSINVC